MDIPSTSKKLLAIKAKSTQLPFLCDPETLPRLLKMMKAGPLSLTRIAKEMFNDVTPYSEARAECLMGDLWDAGVVWCRGDFFNYDYALTSGANEHLKKLLDTDKL